MEAVRSVIRGDLPPAGNTIISSVPDEHFALPEFVNYETLWLSSGTAALAMALVAARQRQPDIEEPEVIIPGYCCPDLVAAARFAGVKPVLVDIAVDDPALDLTALSVAINSQTVAVIAVTFLGIRENLVGLVSLLQNHPHIALIEDNAQWFPEPDELDSLSGDLVIFSFGRGKPVSLLGGGLLLSKIPLKDLPLPLVRHQASASILKLKYLAYNLLLRPRLYQFLNRNPLIKLGETRFHALETIDQMDDPRHRLLPANINKYWQQRNTAETFYDDILAASAIRNHLKPLTSNRRKRLLRYPLLLPDVSQRDELMRRLSSAGLGSTIMYQAPLLEIDGVSAIVKVSGRQPNAADFAARLITLPLHEGVTEKYLVRISKHLRDILYT